MHLTISRHRLFLYNDMLQINLSLSNWVMIIDNTILVGCFLVIYYKKRCECYTLEKAANVIKAQRVLWHSEYVLIDVILISVNSM